jgi:peptidoglycan/LPS O-acetylase OafA/YrhL
MLQRIQTIWMVLAAMAVFLTLKFLFYSGTLIADNSYHALLATDNFLILILTSALGTGIIINLFLYKNRKIQMRIIIIAILLEFLIIFLYIRQTKNYSAGNYSLWSALHILIFLFLIFAAQGIYKDSKLIRDSNRLR